MFNLSFLFIEKIPVCQDSMTMFLAKNMIAACPRLHRSPKKDSLQTPPFRPHTYLPHNLLLHPQINSIKSPVCFAEDID